MSGQLEVLSQLLVGALSEPEAARALHIPLEELVRLRRAVAGESVQLVPVGVDFTNRQVHLIDLLGSTYVEPFFHETVERARRERTELLDMEVAFEAFTRAAEQHTRDPDGLLFHVGRCGSTLLANMLAASPDNLVLKAARLLAEAS